MTKKQKIILTIVAILLVVMSFIGGQVYAKYMSQVNGKGTADIATWSFKVNDKEEKMQNISLNSTINNQTLLNNKIAPGTEGSFQIKIDATGAEVGINYVIKFENESTKPTNLKYKYEDNIYNTLSELQSALTGTINANDNNKQKILTIDWVWDYETGTIQNGVATGDSIDTENGKNIKNYTFDIVVTGTQVNPQS